jgi:hypothetical protein
MRDSGDVLAIGAGSARSALHRPAAIALTSTQALGGTLETRVGQRTRKYNDFVTTVTEFTYYAKFRFQLLISLLVRASSAKLRRWDAAVRVRGA